MNYRYIEELTKPAEAVYEVKDALKWLNVLGYDIVGSISMKNGEKGIQLKCRDNKMFYTDVAINIQSAELYIIGTSYRLWIPKMKVNRNDIITGFLDRSDAMDIDSIVQCISKYDKCKKIICTNCYNIRNDKWNNTYCLQFSNAEFLICEERNCYFKNDDTSCIIMEGPYLIGTEYYKSSRNSYLAEVIRKSKLGLDIILSTADYYNKKTLIRNALS